MGHAWTMPCHGWYAAAHGVFGKRRCRGAAGWRGRRTGAVSMPATAASVAVGAVGSAVVRSS